MQPEEPHAGWGEPGAAGAGWRNGCYYLQCAVVDFSLGGPTLRSLSTHEKKGKEYLTRFLSYRNSRSGSEEILNDSSSFEYEQ